MFHEAYIQPERRPEIVKPGLVRPLYRSEYERLVEIGEFADERLELLCGTLVTMSPQGSRHAAVTARLTRLLVSALADQAVVRSHSPLAISDRSEPEPDVAVVPPGDYFDAHPEQAHLVIEVADSSLGTDRHIKANLYAQAGIPEYWIVNLIEGVVEVYTRIEAGAYTARDSHARDGALTVREFPGVTLAISAFLPPA